MWSKMSVFYQQAVWPALLKMEANQPEEELARMSFVNLKIEVTLSEEDQVCRHNVVSSLNQGSLMKWDP